MDGSLCGVGLARLCGKVRANGGTAFALLTGSRCRVNGKRRLAAITALCDCTHMVELDPRASRILSNRACGSCSMPKSPFWSAALMPWSGTRGLCGIPRISTSSCGPKHVRRALRLLGRAGYQTDLPFPHWIGKAFHGEYFIDVIFNSGNGLCRVDDEWFEHALDNVVLDVPVQDLPGRGDDLAEVVHPGARPLRQRRRGTLAAILRSTARLDAACAAIWPALARALRAFDSVWIHLPGRAE